MEVGDVDSCPTGSESGTVLVLIEEVFTTEHETDFTTQARIHLRLIHEDHGTGREPLCRYELGPPKPAAARPGRRREN